MEEADISADINKKGELRITLTPGQIEDNFELIKRLVDQAVEIYNKN